MTAQGKYTLKENEADARQRLRAFWAGESLGRPAMAVRVKNPSHVPVEWAGPPLTPKQRDLSPEWFAHVAANELHEALYLAEAMPKARVRYGSGLTVVASLAGGDYDYSETTGTSWTHIMHDIYDRPLPLFDPQHPVMQSLRASVNAVCDAAGRQGLVYPPNLLDGLTTLSNLRNSAELCIDVLERPEMVKAWSRALTDIFIACYEDLYQLCLQRGYGEATSWLYAMAEGRMEAVQCDFAVMLSPAMFDEFAMDDLRRVTEYMDYSLYHLDGTCQMRFLDQLASLKKLNGIQWNPEPAALNRSEPQWIEAYRAIRAKGLSLYIFCTVEQAEEITRQIGPDGLFLELPLFETRDQAEQAMRRIERAVK